MRLVGSHSNGSGRKREEWFMWYGNGNLRVSLYKSYRLNFEVVKTGNGHYLTGSVAEAGKESM